MFNSVVMYFAGYGAVMSNGKPSKVEHIKRASSHPDDNSVDVLANDIGIIALFEGDALVGYNLALGGGLAVV